MSDIFVVPINSVYDKVICNEEIASELYEHFSFEHPEADIIRRRVKRLKYWDGQIHLLTQKKRTLYTGLRAELTHFAQDHGYSIEFQFPFLDVEFSEYEANEFVKKMKLPFEIHPHQMQLFLRAIRKERALMLSATSSGKSLGQYLIHRYWNEKTLIVVPNINLVHQMTKHFTQYGYSSEFIHKIYEGQDKQSQKPCFISTFQSIYELPTDFFNQFNNIIVDEVHRVTNSKTIQGIMERATEVDRKIGVTGTIQDLPVNKMVLEGLFGEVYHVISAAELIEKGHAAPLKIKVLLLKYDEIAAKTVSKMKKYSDEVEYVVNYDKRREFIRNLVRSLKGNTLVLFRLVEKHGKILHDELRACLPSDRRVYLIYGAVPGEEREQIRLILEQEKNAVIVGSIACVGTGFDAPTLENMIFTTSTKSKVSVLQSIGRVIRKYGSKECTVFDIADDLTYNKKPNMVLRHCVERVKLYAREFPNDYKIYPIKLY